jgi:hypothetical protein
MSGLCVTKETGIFRQSGALCHGKTLTAGIIAAKSGVLNE